MVNIPHYDIFINYSRRDKDLVEPVVKSLSDSGINVWLDSWNLTPGQIWQETLENAVESSSVIAIFIGPSGLGKYQYKEIERYIESHKQIIPILLPGANLSSLPSALQGYQWVDLRNKASQKSGLNRLLVTLDQSRTGESGINQEQQIADDLFATGDFVGASERYEGALRIARAQDDELRIVRICIRLGDIKSNAGDYASAEQLYEEGLEISRHRNDQQSASAILNQMAYLSTLNRKYESAMIIYEEALRIKRNLGDQQGISATLHNLAQIYVINGNLDRAMQIYEESLKIDETLGDIKGKSATINAMANIYRKRGDLDEAIRLYHQSLKIQEALGDQQYRSVTLHNMAEIYVARGELDRATELYEQSLEIDRSLGNVSGEAATETMLAQLSIDKGQYTTALTSLLNALNTLTRIGNKRDAEKVTNVLIEFRKTLGKESFDVLWQHIASGPLPDWLVQ